jgi:hypothetical protein
VSDAPRGGVQICFGHQKQQSPNFFVKNGEISPGEKKTLDGWAPQELGKVQVSTKVNGERVVKNSGRVLEMSAAVPGQGGRGSYSVRQRQKSREEETGTDRTAEEEREERKRRNNYNRE